MIEISLGQRLRELRDKADLSLRELAKRIGISSPFLSDIELGRRFPSEEILEKLAHALNVSLEDLKKYDNREPIADLKRLMDSDPKLGFAFRTAVEKLKSGELISPNRCKRVRLDPKPAPKSDSGTALQRNHRDGYPEASASRMRCL
jgi:transcriptional regulator with XRE-family HTH domain